MRHGYMEDGPNGGYTNASPKKFSDAMESVDFSSAGKVTSPALEKYGYAPVL